MNVTAAARISSITTTDGRLYRCSFTPGPDYRITADGPTGTKGCKFTVELVLSRDGNLIRSERRLTKTNLSAYLAFRQAQVRGLDYLRTMELNGYVDADHDCYLVLDATLF